MKPILISLAVPFFAVFAVCQSSATEPPLKPNILVLFSDDQGYADLGSQGSEEVKTPHIDSLAANGIRCTAGYVTAPQCGPSRAGLVSGRYQQRFGAEDNGTSRHMLLGGGKTIGDQFQAAGYATGHFGKWHLGDEELVVKHGFDESYGFSDLELEATGGKKTKGKVYQDDRVFASKTADFIERHQDQPWCVYLAFHSPHGPHTKDPEYLARFADAPEDRRGLLASMALLDDAVGIVLEKLNELRMEENTLIFFISDNGGQRYLGRNRKWQMGSENHPFRGGKGAGLEGGVRVPYLVQWKGHLPAGKTYDRPVISLDVIPTALAAASVDPLLDYPLDGVNLLPFLKGEKSTDPHEALFWRWRSEKAIRVGDWKLVTSNDKRSGHPDWVLIDLENDIEERTDLTAQYPEIAKDLLERWSQWNESLPPIGQAIESSPEE